MALPQDVYRELQDILGEDNITDDPAILCGYQWPVREEHIGTVGGFSPMPSAVALPGSTGEVQAIMKLSNRRGIKSRAFSTGYTHYNIIENTDAIFLDLRRMNRILDIDEKNMFIVVEPYVSFAQVQAEAHKRGLNLNIISAGSQTSLLASCTSAHGHATQSISQSFSGRNLLAVEWVLPTGELVKVGSYGSGAGWFSADGPGPSLRGIIRGSGGAYGGLGVFTKCAAHLHPWPGNTVMEVKGISPEYEAEVPPLFEYHVVDFPDWDSFGEAIYRIGKAEIAYVLHKTSGPGSHGAYVTTSNNDYWEKWQEGGLRVPRASLAVILAANSSEEYEYQVKVLDKILEETGGRITPLGEEPLWKNRDYLHLIKVCHIPRQPFRLAGAMVETLQTMESTDHVTALIKADEKLLDKYKETGALMDDGTLNNWMTTYEGGHYSHYEGAAMWDPTDEESLKGMIGLHNEGLNRVEETGANVSCFIPPNPLLRYGPAMSNLHLWMRKVKREFDPNDVSDNTWYISGKEE